MNNDPGTLEIILDWGLEHLGTHKIQEIVNARYNKVPTQDTIDFFSSDSVDKNPILLCSLEHYSACLELLYKSGYRINLPQIDEKRITAILDLNLIRAKNFRLDYALSN